MAMRPDIRDARRAVPAAGLALLAYLLVSAAAEAQESKDVAVPDGFEATLFADDDLAHDIFSMAIDSFGRVVVSGSGYVKILQDTNGDGRAD